MYKLSDAVTYLAGMPFSSVVVEGELVDGLFDGVTSTFRVASPPILDGDALVITDVTGTETYDVTACNADTGFFTVDPAPVSPIMASYTATIMALSKWQWICRAGLDEMETRWRRGYKWATVDQSDYAISSSATTATDPAIPGSTTFSDSRVQVAFYNACCEYVMARQLSAKAIQASMIVREERIGGLAIDATRRARDWSAELDRLEKILVEREAQARAEAGETDEFGSFISGPQLVNGRWTDDYSVQL